MLTFDHVVIQILENCGCIQYISKFAGLTIEKLNKYTLKDFIGLLGSDESNARKIHDQVQRSKKGNEGQQSVDNDVEIIDVIVRYNLQLATKEEEIIDDAEEEQTDSSPVEKEEVNNFSGDTDDGPQYPNNLTFDNLTSTTSFISILQSFRESELKNLKTLSMKTKAMNSCLTQEQLLQLVNIKAPSLKELELGYGLWEDVQGTTIQQILSTFPTLKRFVVHGTFKGSSETLPKILIVFPPMPNLEYIEFGANYGYSTTTTRASGKGINSTTSSSAECFSVTLQFPFLLPRLVQMYLGNMFQLQEFHFSNFPQLKSFCAGSRWDLAVIFPPLSSRHVSYPLITKLQIPDCLSDPSFLKLIPTRFPNLIRCEIRLPTVKILRTFFSIMADSKLKQLVLRTQYDFASSLETCLLGKPTKVIQSKSELEKVCLLKQYKYWKELVQHHNIQLPEEDLSSLEGKGLAGLSALKNLQCVTFNHQCRILEIPKGRWHWASSDCEYTREFIGFEKYPWSAKCEKLRNDLLHNCPGFDDRYLRYDVKFRVPKQPNNLGLMCKTRPTRKEIVKPEKKETQD